MAVPEILNTVEQSGLSMWIRNTDSLFGFYFILLLHTIGLSLLVGASVVVDLRILGVAPDLPLKSLKWLFRVMWAGFFINAPTGLLLLISYPTKALTNPDFYIKLSLIGISLVVMQKIKTRVFDDSLSEPDMVARGKTMAKYSLALWAASITAGRLLAYTYTYLLYGVYAVVTLNTHI